MFTMRELHFGGISGNAGLFSNANDMAKIYQMWLNEGSMVENASSAKKPSGCLPRQKAASVVVDWDSTNPTLKIPRQVRVAKTPSSVYGHTVSQYLLLRLTPENQLIYIFLSNRVYPSNAQQTFVDGNQRAHSRRNIQCIYQIIGSSIILFLFVCKKS